MRIAIISDVRLHCEGLALLLAHEPDLSLVGSAATLPEALTMVSDLSPDVLLADHGMIGLPEGMKALLRRVPGLKVLVFGVSEQEDEVLRWAEAGAAGYAAREASPAELVATLRSVHRGELLCSPSIAASLMRRVASGPGRSVPAGLHRLTRRERETVQLIAEGLTNRAIAERLGIELATVKNHVHRLLAKLQVRGRYEVAAWLRSTPPAPEEDLERVAS